MPPPRSDRPGKGYFKRNHRIPYSYLNHGLSQDWKEAQTIPRDGPRPCKLRRAEERPQSSFRPQRECPSLPVLPQRCSQRVRQGALASVVTAVTPPGWLPAHSTLSLAEEAAFAAARKVGQGDRAPYLPGGSQSAPPQVPHSEARTQSSLCCRPGPKGADLWGWLFHSIELRVYNLRPPTDLPQHCDLLPRSHPV